MSRLLLYRHGQVKRDFAYLSLVADRTRDEQQRMLKNRINEIRNARDISVEELAERTGLSASYISRMSRGERNISLKNLEKLATALDCTPEELMGGAAPVEPDIAEIWAAIPEQNKELARRVLEGFIGKNTKK